MQTSSLLGNRTLFSPLYIHQGSLLNWSSFATQGRWWVVMQVTAPFVLVGVVNYIIWELSAILLVFVSPRRAYGNVYMNLFNFRISGYALSTNDRSLFTIHAPTLSHIPTKGTDDVCSDHGCYWSRRLGLLHLLLPLVMTLFIWFFIAGKLYIAINLCFRMYINHLEEKRI